jgi:hypothetical protein
MTITDVGKLLLVFFFVLVPVFLLLTYITMNWVEKQQLMKKYLCKFGKLPHNYSDWIWGQDKSTTACHKRVCQNCGEVEWAGTHHHITTSNYAQCLNEQVETCTSCGNSFSWIMQHDFDGGDICVICGMTRYQVY